MSTKSFTNDSFIINNRNALMFRNIMNEDKKIQITKVSGHKTVKDKDKIKELLKL